MTCEEQVQRYLYITAGQNKEPGPILWSEPECQGKMFPQDVYNFFPFESDIPVPLESVGSMFVPNHVEMRFQADSGHIHTVFGGQIIKNTWDKHLGMKWHEFDNPVCSPYSETCGQDVGWSPDPQNALAVVSVRAQRLFTWDNYVKMLSTRGGHLHVGGLKPVQIDTDKHMQKLCDENQFQKGCQCHEALKRAEETFGKLEDLPSFRVELLPNACDADQHHMPPLLRERAKKVATQQDCHQMAKELIQKGLLKPANKGGPDYFRCNGDSYMNTDHYTESERDAMHVSLIVIGIVACFGSIYFLYCAYRAPSLIREHLNARSEIKHGVL